MVRLYLLHGNTGSPPGHGLQDQDAGPHGDGGDLPLAAGVRTARPARPLLHLLRVAAVHTAALPPAHLGTEAARRAALAELAPAAPGRGRRGGGDLSLGPGQVAAVVLGVVEVSELLAVVGAAHELAPAAGVAVMQPPVPRPVAVALAVLARGLGGAAAPAVVVPARTLVT